MIEVYLFKCRLRKIECGVSILKIHSFDLFHFKINISFYLSFFIHLSHLKANFYFHNIYYLISNYLSLEYCLSMHYSEYMAIMFSALNAIKDHFHFAIIQK